MTKPTNTKKLTWDWNPELPEVLYMEPPTKLLKVIKGPIQMEHFFLWGVLTFM
eukprot:Awhi_evm1s14123